MAKGHQIKQIVVSDDKYGLPYSKGLMASKIMATGLDPTRAYQVATLIEDHLKANNKLLVNVQELRELACNLLRSQVGEEYAERYARWHALARLDKPMIILIGGTTGVGKSTIATEIAHRLGIRHIVSTDSIREVMRTIFSKELMPTLYESSFNAWQMLRAPLSPKSDSVIVGFEEQVKVVVVGIRSIIERAVKEGVSMIIEGVHIVPGFLNLEGLDDNAFVIELIINVEDEKRHRSHFYVRELKTGGFRPFDRYRANFENIRKIGEYIEGLTRRKNIPMISSDGLDITINQVLEEILNQVFKSEKAVKSDARENI